jgi:hypothetical protein
VDGKPYYRLIVSGLESHTIQFLVKSKKCETAPVVWEGADPFSMPVSAADTFLAHLSRGDRLKVIFTWQDCIDGDWGDCPNPLVRPY